MQGNQRFSNVADQKTSKWALDSLATKRLTVHTQCFDNNSNFTKVLVAKDLPRISGGLADSTQDYAFSTSTYDIDLAQARDPFRGGDAADGVLSAGEVSAEARRFLTPFVQAISLARGRFTLARPAFRAASTAPLPTVRVRAQAPQNTRGHPGHRQLRHSNWPEQPMAAADYLPMKSLLPISTPLWRRMA